MTDRVKGFTVTLAEDVRIDDVEPVMNAIRMIKGVVDVEPSITNSDDHMNRMVITSKIRLKLIDFIQKEL
jgi:hypothetical protein